MSLIEEIRQSWGWTGLSPADVIAENDFGNLLIQDVGGAFWRLCPEDLYCRMIARTRDKFDALVESDDFRDDWQMEALVELGREKFGPLPEGLKYCLKVRGVLGGQ